MMLLSTRLRGMRILVRSHIRFYRKRRLPVGGHIPSMRVPGDLPSKNEKMFNLNSKSPEEFEKNLKAIGFEEIETKESNQDLLLSYLKYANAGFKKSTKNLRKLQKQLNGQQLNDDSKLKLFFDYLVEESELEIRRLETMSKNDLETKYRTFDYKEAINKPIESEEQLEEKIMAGMFKSPGDSEGTYLTNTDFIYHILTDLNNRNDPKFLSIEQLVEAFELAKLVPIEGRRKRGIFLAGNLIYKLGNVRMDPVNESFYIDSLVNYGSYKKAFNLFESNREKVDHRWWYEMGMMIALRANYLRKFDKLLSLADDKFNSFPYVSPKVLKVAIKKKLFLRDFDSANKLTERFLNIINRMGCKKQNETMKETQKMITFQSSGKAEEFLNEMEIPTDYDFINVIEYHLFRKNFDTAFRLMARYLETPGMDEQNHKFLIIRMKLNLLKNCDDLKRSLEPHFASGNPEKLLAALETSFNQVVKELNLASANSEGFLFDDVNSLVSSTALRNIIEDFVTKDTADINKNVNKDLLSKRLHCLLKVLLASGKEAEALKVLSKMEETHSQSGDLREIVENSIFSESNAHHYAQFVEYYTILTMKSLRKKRYQYTVKVSDILKRMDRLKVSPNAVLFTRLLVFYRETNNFDRCFELINNVLKVKQLKDSVPDANRTNIYGRRDITRPLYIEIWKVYSKYYKIFTKELGRVEKKSNYVAWKMNTSNIIQQTNIHPEFSIRSIFFNMIQTDNILPDARLYYIILLAFMRRRDWSAIPSILTSMSKVHDLEISESLVKYFMKGLEREFILLDGKRREEQGLKPEEAKLKSRESLLGFKKLGQIVTPEPKQPETARKLLEQMQFLFQSTDANAYSTAEVNAAKKDMGLSIS